MAAAFTLGLDLRELAERGPSGLFSGARGYVLDSLALAVAAVTDRRPLEDILVDVVRVGGDTDSNAAIAGRLFLSESAVGKHIASIFTKLDLPASDDDNRRVLAVLAYLQA